MPAIPYKISGDSERYLPADFEIALFSNIYTSSRSPVHYRSPQTQQILEFFNPKESKRNFVALRKSGKNYSGGSTIWD